MRAQCDESHSVFGETRPHSLGKVTDASFAMQHFAQPWRRSIHRSTSWAGHAYGGGVLAQQPPGRCPKSICWERMASLSKRRSRPGLFSMTSSCAMHLEIYVMCCAQLAGALKWAGTSQALLKPAHSSNHMPDSWLTLRCRLEHGFW